MLFVHHKPWFSVVSVGRCSLFPSRVGLRTYQHPCTQKVRDCRPIKTCKIKAGEANKKNYMTWILDDTISKNFMLCARTNAPSNTLHPLVFPLTLHLIHFLLPHRSALPNHVSPSSSHHTYSAFPIPLSTPERDRPFKDRCSVLLSIGCRSTN